MKKLKRRARLCIALALVLFLGLGFYVYKLAVNGGDWAAYPGNGDVYSKGYLDKGTIYDRDGTLLMQNTDSGVPVYNDSYAVRCGTLHAVGDAVGNISTGANKAFADKLIGYNFLMGTYTINNKGRNLYLTIDADICAAAYNALGDRSGTVGVYNYRTGEILCMVSSPNYDPLDPPTIGGDDTSGIYLNKFLSSTFVPGSIFKVITSMAAIENLDGLDNYTFNCEGSVKYGEAETDKVTCPYVHGTVDFKGALAYSCNCAFADLSIRLGPSMLEKYAKKAGIGKSYSVDGIQTAKGSFDFPGTDVTLAWSGIGQYNDLVNPCAMMVFMGAIANGGEGVEPTLIKDVTYANGWSADFSLSPGSSELVDPETAKVLEEMLHNDVVQNYGEANFPGLDLCAKSGTGETGDGKDAHAWFYGYIRNPGYPYAFVVLVEHGGYGSTVAGSVANQVLQEVIAGDPAM